MSSSRTSFRVHLESRRARFTDGIVEHFGDPRGERQALGHSPTLHALCADGLLSASGPDAQAFLQGQLSNDIRELDAGRAQLTTWSTPQGRVLATFLAWREQDDYLLQLPLELALPVRARLERFILRARAKLDDASGSRALIGLGGPGSRAALAAVFEAIPAAPMQMVEAAQGTRILMLRPALYEIALPPEQAPAIWDLLSQRARPAGTRAWDWLRIQACLPDITAPTQDRFIPQMADLEHAGAVSFSKGCYPGQEVVARAQYLGQVKRRLFRVHSEEEGMAPGQEVWSDGSPVGTILNAAAAPGGGCDALAVLQTDAASRSGLVLADTEAALTVVSACH